jgi:hypothetical protein
MFESIQNPVKGKGKEKDVGKRRAYVRVVTSLGGGLNLELFCEKVCQCITMSASELRQSFRPRKLVITS